MSLACASAEAVATAAHHGQQASTHPVHISQVLALCAAPFLLEHPQVEQMFPKDAIARAKHLLAAFKGGVGAYSDSRGNPLVREEVAKFIEERDGVKANPNVRAASVHC
jgi:aspartate/methionine/tyrosine aminotransferase